MIKGFYQYYESKKTRQSRYVYIQLKIKYEKKIQQLEQKIDSKDKGRSW